MEKSVEQLEKELLELQQSWQEVIISLQEDVQSLEEDNQLFRDSYSKLMSVEPEEILSISDALVRSQEGFEEKEQNTIQLIGEFLISVAELKKRKAF